MSGRTNLHRQPPFIPRIEKSTLLRGTPEKGCQLSHDYLVPLHQARARGEGIVAEWPRGESCKFIGNRIRAVADNRNRLVRLGIVWDPTTFIVDSLIQHTETMKPANRIVESS